MPCVCIGTESTEKTGTVEPGHSCFPLFALLPAHFGNTLQVVVTSSTGPCYDFPSPVASWHTFETLKYGHQLVELCACIERVQVCKIHKLGWGQWDELKAEIRKSYLFRFDWFLKSRTAQELQRRCDQLVRLIEKEQEDDDEKPKRSNKKVTLLPRVWLRHCVQ